MVQGTRVRRGPIASSMTIGWDDTRRRAHLHRVLGLCRLLVRPGICCRNLASHVLGRAARAVGDDFERLHGYRPWLLEIAAPAPSPRRPLAPSVTAVDADRATSSAGRGWATRG